MQYFTKKYEMKITSKILKTFVLLACIFTATLSWSQSEATYNISATTIWNSTDHTSLPGNAHWSNLIGATHNTANEFVEIGQLATTGIKNVAENGSNSVFISEINSAINANKADQLLQDGFSPFAGNDSMAGLTGVTVSEDFPLVTLVSMVAPSPDWFIAVNSLNLRSGNPSVNNGWKDTFTMDVFVYDAGTDEGTNYTSGDNASNPFLAVSMITGTPINGNKMAEITFTYVSSTLGTEDLTLIENVKIYPNPATSVLIITNPASNLESAELYNVLGKRVNVVSATTSTDITMNLEGLQSGVYILRLKNTNGDTTARKVIIE